MELGRLITEKHPFLEGDTEGLAASVNIAFGHWRNQNREPWSLDDRFMWSALLLGIGGNGSYDGQCFGPDGGFGEGGGGSRPYRAKLKDLQPIDRPATSKPRPELEKLTDRELLDAVNRPYDNDPVTVNTDTGILSDGNGRIYEMKRRIAKGK